MHFHLWMFFFVMGRHAFWQFCVAQNCAIMCMCHVHSLISICHFTRDLWWRHWVVRVGVETVAVTWLLCVQWTHQHQFHVQLVADTHLSKKVLLRSCLQHVSEASQNGQDILLIAWSLCQSSSHVITTQRRFMLMLSTALPSTTQPNQLENMVSNSCS